MGNQPTSQQNVQTSVAQPSGAAGISPTGGISQPGSMSQAPCNPSQIPPPNQVITCQAQVFDNILIIPNHADIFVVCFVLIKYFLLLFAAWWDFFCPYSNGRWATTAAANDCTT